MNTRPIIEISKSSTADTRTCDFKNVSMDTLANSSIQHIRDVRAGINLWCEMLVQAGEYHDFTKRSRLGWFHEDFVTGFEKHGWWDMHRQAERHHLGNPDGVPSDVNLVDVLEYITDCVMAGMARSGKVHRLEITAEVLQRAFDNTAKLLESRVVVRPTYSEGMTFPGDEVMCRAAELVRGGVDMAGAPLGEGHKGKTGLAADRSACGRHTMVMAQGGMGMKEVCMMDGTDCDGLCGEHASRAVEKAQKPE